jgi:hypothetical protein
VVNVCFQCLWWLLKVWYVYLCVCMCVCVCVCVCAHVWLCVYCVHCVHVHACMFAYCIHHIPTCIFNHVLNSNSRRIRLASDLQEPNNCVTSVCMYYVSPWISFISQWINDVKKYPSECEPKGLKACLLIAYTLDFLDFITYD